VQPFLNECTQQNILKSSISPGTQQKMIVMLPFSSHQAAAKYYCDTWQLLHAGSKIKTRINETVKEEIQKFNPQDTGE